MDKNLENVQILVVDDELPFVSMISKFLVSRGAHVTAVQSLETLPNMDDTEIQLMLLDKNINGSDAFPFIEVIRKNPAARTISLMVITGSDGIDVKKEALYKGADDIMVKPIDLAELEARILALLRRSQSYIPKSKDLKVEDIIFQLESEVVSIEGTEIDLTPVEYNIFLELVTHRDSLVRKERLIARSLPSCNVGPKTLNVHISSLRRKIGKNFAKQLKTVRGKGFSFNSK